MRKKYVKVYISILIMILIATIIVETYYIFNKRGQTKETVNIELEESISETEQIEKEYKKINENCKVLEVDNNLKVFMHITTLNIEGLGEEYADITLKLKEENKLERYNLVTVYFIFDLEGQNKACTYVEYDINASKTSAVGTLIASEDDIIENNTSNNTENNEEVSKTTGLAEDIILTAGKYTVGEDIKAGKYDAIAQSGQGNIYVKGSTSVIETMGTTGTYSILNYNNITLKEGDTVEITSTLNLLLQAK